MQSEEQKQQVKAITEQALSRFEELQLNSEHTPSAPSLVKKDDMLSELDQLPPPPKSLPAERGVGKSTSLPRGTHAITCYETCCGLTVH